jgi:hypothetical protein
VKENQILKNTTNSPSNFLYSSPVSPTVGSKAMSSKSRNTLQVLKERHKKPYIFGSRAMNETIYRD